MHFIFLSFFISSNLSLDTKTLVSRAVNTVGTCGVCATSNCAHRKQDRRTDRQKIKKESTHGARSARRNRLVTTEKSLRSVVVVGDVDVDVAVESVVK